MYGSGMSEDEKITFKQMFWKSSQSEYSEYEMEEAELYIDLLYPGEKEEIVNVGRIMIPKEEVNENGADYQNLGSYRKAVLRQHNHHRKKHGAGKLTLSKKVRIIVTQCRG